MNCKKVIYNFRLTLNNTHTLHIEMSIQLGRLLTIQYSCLMKYIERYTKGEKLERRGEERGRGERVLNQRESEIKKKGEKRKKKTGK